MRSAESTLRSAQSLWYDVSSASEIQSRQIAAAAARTDCAVIFNVEADADTVGAGAGVVTGAARPLVLEEPPPTPVR